MGEIIRIDARRKMAALTIDCAPQRTEKVETPQPSMSFLFGCLACCFAFGVTFMAAVCGVPGI
ncbi:MAG: hypothetical protein ACTHJQ_22010 [Rhizobiaceae bacterium]